jgi:serine/threonine protein kinase/Tol biopolymer transport system component
MTPHDWKRVRAIAGEAWTLPVTERISYVARLCGADEALNAEVLSLLASMDAAVDCFEVAPTFRVNDIGVHASLIGCRVGVYEILSRIGAGGMGEVYKARDTRLNRIVAIKTVPLTASGPISRERTEHEARAVAALNHPHICTLYDIGNHDGLDFLVMQYVEGETLADRLSRGRLAVAEALRYADQIASALAEAHRVGIVHRDVKPANIMLDRAGVQSAGAPQAKLLDFGVAKANSFETPFSSTLGKEYGAPHLTAPGLVVGTPQYMAPEQFERKATDVRTDVFAFGAVLFEMLTGRKAFEGADRAAVLAAIREKELSPVSALVPGIPSSLDRLVSRSLTKNPDERYQTMDDLLIDLRAVRRQLDSSPHAATVVFGVAVFTIVIGAVIASALWARREVAANVSPSISRLPASAGVLSKAALSPDGSSVVFPWTGDGIEDPELVLIRIGTGTRVRLTTDPGTEEWPAWSPDGRQIAFIRCGSERCGIFTLPIDGGPEHKLRDLRYDRYNDLAWSPDGQSIVYAERPSASEAYALFDLSLDKSSTRRLTAPRSVNLGELRFAFSPDGTMLAIIRIGTSIEVLLHSIKDGTEKILLTGQHEWFGGVEWSADAQHLILSANQRGVRGLWTLPVTGGDLQRLAVAGEDSFYPSLSSRSGRLAFVREFRDWDFTRVAIGRRSVHASASFPSSGRLDLDPAFSPDGRKLAFVSERSGTREVWVSNADGGEAVQLTSFGGTTVGRPSWSPDGQFLAFHAAGIHIVPATGGPPRRVADSGEMPSWSADARSIYFMRSMPQFQVWKVPAAGGRAVQAITSEAFTPRESSDGLNLYFPTAGGGIWRRPVAGGVETQVIQDFEWPLPGYWALFEGGIYYVARETLFDHTVVNRLKFFDFIHHRTVILGLLTGAIDDWVGGLTVSSDRKTLLYSHRTYQSSEVVLVEHFR